MKRILFSLIFLFVSSISSIEPVLLPVPSTPSKKIESIVDKAVSGALYLVAGAAFLSVSFLAKLGWAACLISPWQATTGNECLILSHLTGSVAKVFFSQIGSRPAFSSLASWEHNRELLAQIPTFSEEENELCFFLERRWLAKCAGFFPILVNRICPLFGISVQTHPETQSCYARDPRRTMSDTYKKRMDAWKKALPQPHAYPLLLTRPASLQDYFPSYFTISKKEELKRIFDQIHSTVVLDLSAILTQTLEEDWLKAWEELQLDIPKGFHENLLCVQRVQKGGLGGLRLLPFSEQKPSQVEKGYRYLLEWISFFGLTANRVELDRLIFPSDLKQSQALPLSVEFQSKEELTSRLDVFYQKWQSTSPQKTLLFEGTLQVLKGLLQEISDASWTTIMNCPTRSLIAQVSFQKIQKQLESLIQEEAAARFFDTAEKIEQIHADLTALIEVFSPFTAKDFPAIYQKVLKKIPAPLKPLTSFSIHASGMTSMAGVLHATEKVCKAPPRIIFGDNTYYECLMIGDHVSNCVPIEEASEEDWAQVDLILAQFNPALKRTHLEPTEYKIEQVAETVAKALKFREEKPLVVALDCTIDYIDSSRAAALIETFQREIEEGRLNIICYRSGLKFDLFGMDNYCGAPFFTVHNDAEHWKPFDALLFDEALVTDPLSINWFCLAYKHAAPYLENYRKDIFDNTRSLLEKIPPRLFEADSPYRVVAVDQETDLCFVDIKVTGPLHIVRGSALAGGLLYFKSMEKGFPIFYRRSIGFYHSNFAMLFSEENATIRLTLGIDSEEVDLFVETFEVMDTLNGASPQALLEKI